MTSASGRRRPLWRLEVSPGKPRETTAKKGECENRQLGRFAMRRRTRLAREKLGLFYSLVEAVEKSQLKRSASDCFSGKKALPIHPHATHRPTIICLGSGSALHAPYPSSPLCAIPSNTNCTANADSRMPKIRLITCMPVTPRKRWSWLAVSMATKVASMMARRAARTIS